VDSEAPLLYGYVRPDVIDELLLRDDLTRAVDKIDQNIQRSTVEGKHLAVASEHPLANRKFERTELQLPMNYSARHVSAKMRGFPRMPTVGRQTPQLCTRKVGHYEAHRPSHAFGKDELNLDITSTRRSSRTSRRCDDNDGKSSMRRYDRLALRVQSLNSRDQPAEDGLVFLFAPAAMPI
jgi:hypothetical protein